MKSWENRDAVVKISQSSVLAVEHSGASFLETVAHKDTCAGCHRTSSRIIDTKQDGSVLYVVYIKFWPYRLNLSAYIETNQTRQCF